MDRAHDILYYDGHCGMCRHSVKRVLRADAGGSLFRFSPLQGRHIRNHLTKEQRSPLPDSLVVLCVNGRILTRSDATIYILDRLAGRHRIWARLCRLIPRPIRDGIYRMIAYARRHFFARLNNTCPIVPPQLRERFLD